MACYKYVKNGKIRALKDPDLTDSEDGSSSEEDMIDDQKVDHSIVNASSAVKPELNFVWYITDETGQMESCDYETSLQLNQLQINGEYKTMILGTEYVFAKIDDDICSRRQVDDSEVMHTVIRKAVEKQHQNNGHSTNPTNAQQQSEAQMDYFWCWESDDGYIPYESAVSVSIEQLVTGQSVNLTINGVRYEIKKDKFDKAIQTNSSNGKYRNAIRQSNHHEAISHQSNSKGGGIGGYSLKWYWKRDDGQFEPFSSYVSTIVESLQIGGSTKMTLDNREYEINRTDVSSGHQTNLATGGYREIRRR